MYRNLVLAFGFMLVAVVVFSNNWSESLPGKAVSPTMAAELIGGRCGVTAGIRCADEGCGASGSGYLPDSKNGVKCDVMGSSCNSNCNIWNNRTGSCAGG